MTRLDQRGVVAIEFAVVASVLVPLLLGVADVGDHLRRRLEVEGVAVAAARAVAATCADKLPALRNCAALDAAVAATQAGSTLGGRATLRFDEAEYCAVGGRLSRVGAAGRGAVCPGGTPAGDYLVVTASAAARPLFVGALLPARIVRTTTVRLR